MKGYEHLVVTFWVDKIEPQHYFSFRWHPDATDVAMDYSKEPTTLVEFKLVDVDGGTELTIVESGFDAIPESRRAKAFASNGSATDPVRIATANNLPLIMNVYNSPDFVFNVPYEFTDRFAGEKDFFSSELKPGSRKIGSSISFRTSTRLRWILIRSAASALAA